MLVRHLAAAAAVVAMAAAAAAVLPAQAWAGSPPPRSAAPPAPVAVREVELGVPTTDGLVLPATLRIPLDAGPDEPGMVLVHGAGPGPREKYRAEAEAFERAGIA